MLHASGRAIVVADDDPGFVTTPSWTTDVRADQEPIAAVVSRYDLDRGTLDAAVRSALAVPDRVVVLDVLPPAA